MGAALVRGAAESRFGFVVGVVRVAAGGEGLRLVTFLVVHDAGRYGRSPVPGYAAEEAFARSREAFAELERWLEGPEAAGLAHAELEDQIGERGRELQRLQFQAHLDLRAAREVRRHDVTGPDGSARPRAERGRTRRLSSVFGPVIVSRIAYRAPGMPDVHPADAELNLPPG